MSEVIFPSRVIVTEQEINLSHLTDAQKTHYRKLAERVAEIYNKSNSNRIIIGLGGPSGSGKSVTAEILCNLIPQQYNNFAVYTADIDAFHYKNEHLHLKKGTDGKVLRAVKGRHDTYDTGSLAKKLHAFLNGDNVDFPCYSRKLHEPVQKCYTTPEPKALLILAGLWLLYDHPAWAVVREHIAHTFLIHGDSDLMKKHTIARHVRGGRSKEDAELFYATSDHLNLKELERNSVAANEILPHHESVK